MGILFHGSSPFRSLVHLSFCSPGESGLGKSTMIKTLFAQEDLEDESHTDRVPASQRVEKTVSITPHVFRLAEHNVNLTLTIIDTPGPFTCGELTAAGYLCRCPVIV